MNKVVRIWCNSLPPSPWHTSCTITASMWKQGCIQSNRCPNHVHVPRHSSALRPHAPSHLAFSLRALTVQSLAQLCTPQGGFSKYFEISGVNFFLEQETTCIPQCLSPPMCFAVFTTGFTGFSPLFNRSKSLRTRNLCKFTTFYRYFFNRPIYTSAPMKTPPPTLTKHLTG
jgi:hypothetical protein